MRMNVSNVRLFSGRRSFKFQTSFTSRAFYCESQEKAQYVNLEVIQTNKFRLIKIRIWFLGMFLY